MVCKPSSTSLLLGIQHSLPSLQLMALQAIEEAERSCKLDTVASMPLLYTHVENGLLAASVCELFAVAQSSNLITAYLMSSRPAKVGHTVRGMLSIP